MKINRNQLRKLILQEVSNVLLETTTFEGDNLEEAVLYAIYLAGRNGQIYNAAQGVPETDDTSVDPDLIIVTVVKPGAGIGSPENFYKFKSKAAAAVELNKIRNTNPALFKQPEVTGGVQEHENLTEGKYFFIEFYVDYNVNKD